MSCNLLVMGFRGTLVTIPSTLYSGATEKACINLHNIDFDVRYQFQFLTIGDVVLGKAAVIVSGGMNLEIRETKDKFING